MRKKTIILLFIFILTLFVAIGKANAQSNSTNLYELIKSKALNTTVDFKLRSGAVGQETNGIYITNETDSGKPVYYYRGDVNNNVIFNNMCWKIIRTTETGGVKLIYNGIPTDGKCTATGADTEIGKSAFNINNEDNAYVGYMYGKVPSTTKEEAQTNTNDSTMKTYIDNWYSENFTDTSITSKLEDTVFYNDRELTTSGNNNKFFNIPEPEKSGYGNNTTLYNSAARATYYTINPKPSLKNPIKNDKFTVNSKNGNGLLTYPVGLITLDEVVLAGFNTYESNNLDYKDTNNYLYTGSCYWTMTPVSVYSMSIGRMVISGSVEGVVLQDSIGSNFNHDTTVGVRPVISLTNEVVVQSTGDGSSTNPYFVSLYTIKFNTNSESIIDNQYVFDNNSKIVKPENPTKENYTFAGWYVDEGLNIEYDFDNIVTKDMTLYAKWTEVHGQQIENQEEKRMDNPPTGDTIIYVLTGLMLSVIGICIVKIKS